MSTYPDPEQWLIDWLKAAPRSWANVTDELPTNLAGVLKDGPCVVVARFGGADRFPGLDMANVAVDVYAIGRAAAKLAAAKIRRSITVDLQGVPTGGVIASRVATIAAPTVRPYDSATIRLVGASYQLTLHSGI